MSSQIPGIPADLPPALAHLAAWTWQPITIGKSDAAVWQLSGSAETLFLKAAPRHPLAELPGEAERLRWLNTMGVAAPRLQQFEADEHRYWLLMDALPGQDLTHLTGQPDLLVEVLATALRQLHSLDPQHCPFDHRLPQRLLAGERNMAAGLVDEDDFDTGHIGWTAGQVLAWLLDNQPLASDLVVTHGDVSLPNLMASDGVFTGFVDCGRLGVADCWQDLAIACRSLAHNCGEAHVHAFLEAYGAAWDEERHRYYNALDELF